MQTRTLQPQIRLRKGAIAPTGRSQCSQCARFFGESSASARSIRRRDQKWWQGAAGCDVSRLASAGFLTASCVGISWHRQSRRLAAKTMCLAHHHGRTDGVYEHLHSQTLHHQQENQAHATEATGVQADMEMSWWRNGQNHRHVRRRKEDSEDWGVGGEPPTNWNQNVLNETLKRVILPTLLSFFGGIYIYIPICQLIQELLDIGNTGQGPVLTLLGMDQSQFMQNFLTVNGLLFTILCGNTYQSLYNQQERLYHALFLEVSEAKSLLEQACLLCQTRPFYPKVLMCIGDYVNNDLCRLDLEPADLLANRPMDDPLECILYVTSVGVPSIIYETVRDLRQARGKRLGAMQRKLPPVHFVLLYVLGLLELLAFPLLGAGTASMFRERNVLTVQAFFFGAMCGAIVMTLQVIYELWRPSGGAYNVDYVLIKMVKGLQEELSVRRSMAEQTTSAMQIEAPTNMPQ